MSRCILIPLLWLLAGACRYTSKPTSAILQADTTPAVSASPTVNVTKASAPETKQEEAYDYQTTPFTAVSQYPHIKDSTAFIKALVENCHIATQYHHHPTINYFKKIQLYGSDRFYYLIEYDYHNGSTGSFPWKSQYLFSASGKLLKIIRAMKLNPATIFPGEHPFLIGVCATGKGNGWHEIYRIQADTAVQVFDQFKGNRPQTYDAHEDDAINIPNEFPYTLEDINQDGYNDLVFRGKIHYYHIAEDYDGKTIRARFVFLYHPENGHFTTQENYSKKYAFVYGNTWK